MTRRTPSIPLFIALVAASGCASGARLKAQQGEIDQLKAQLSSVERENAELRKDQDSMKNELFILHDRVETARTQLARTAPATPPKLEVVKLAPSAEPDPVLKVRTAARLEPSEAAQAAGDPQLSNQAYDPSADEASLFSFSGDDAAAAAASDALVAPPKANHKKGPLPKDAVVETGPPGAEAPMSAYQKAFGLYQAKQYEDAILAFQKFADDNPTHEYADNAYYWMGECYYSEGEYALAAGEFQKVPELYPGGNKVPDALYKLGLTYEALNNRKSAEKTLKQLVDSYPQSNAAGMARTRLAKLAQAPQATSRGGN